MPIIPKYIKDIAKNIKMEKEKSYKNYNPKIVDLYEILKTEIINSLLEGQYKLLHQWNDVYSLSLTKGLNLDIIVSDNAYTNEKTINSLKLESITNRPDWTAGTDKQIIEKLKSKSKEEEILELEERMEKLNKQIQQLKGE